MTTNTENKRIRELEGAVVGNKMQDTVKVRVDVRESHPVYKKVIDRKKTFFAHTSRELNIGDKVVIRECKPYSKNVRWTVINN